jgi:hypothetical protein
VDSPPQPDGDGLRGAVRIHAANPGGNVSPRASDDRARAGTDFPWPV